MTDISELLPWVVILLPAAAAWGGVRVGLNGARSSIAQIAQVVNRLDDKVDSHGERIASLEAETSNLKERR